MRRLLTTRSLSPLVVLAFAACSHKPPADFAPDPGLLSHIRDIEITVTPAAACPGGLIQASYQAVIDDGTRVPFIRSYDKKHPPRLHTVFLSYTSLEASGTKDGNMPHAFAFSGSGGEPMQGGANGPDVRVRLGMGRSPFYERLLVVGVEVGAAPPFYLLYDARAIPPADWLAIESRGGRAVGGPGGPGGPGGSGGDGGKGGQGVTGSDNKRCADAADGTAGRKGAPGPVGRDGPRGPRHDIYTVAAGEVFGPDLPPELAAVLEETRR